MNRYIVIARITTNPSETDEYAKFSALVPAEYAHVMKLRQENRMGFVHLALEQQTVFIEVFAENKKNAELTLDSLPLAPWMKFEIYPTITPEEANKTA